MKTPTLELHMRVNGRAVALEIEPRELLIDVLRNRLGLTGTKKSCDVEVCGACTVLVDGKTVSSCTYLAFECEGRDVQTIEGLADGETLHPIQQAFVDHQGLQCGFCTPGMIMATKALLDENPDPSAPEIKAYMRGNICRCTGYHAIVTSIQHAARETARS